MACGATEVTATAANAYPRVRVVLVKGSSTAWSQLCHFRSLHGIQAYGIDQATRTRLGEIPASIAELVLGVDEQPGKVVDILPRFTALKTLSFDGKLDGIGSIVKLQSLQSLHQLPR